MTTPPWGQQPDDPNSPSQGGQQPYQPYQGYPPAPGASLPAHGYGYAPTPSTNGMAIASLVVSILSLTACVGATGFIGAIFGHMAKGQIKRSNDQGRGLATAGIIIGWLGTALFLLGVAAIVIISILAVDSYDGCYERYDGTYRCD